MNETIYIALDFPFSFLFFFSNEVLSLHLLSENYLIMCPLLFIMNYIYEIIFKNVCMYVC
jgi:hypothetical protein